MRAIGQLPGEQAARVFGDYLMVQGIQNEAEPDDAGQWTVWVLEDDRVAQAQSLLDEFRQHPKDAKYKQAATKAEDLRDRKEQEEKAWQKRFHQRPALWRGGQGRIGWVTAMLTGICVAVALADALLGPGNALIQLLRIQSYREADGLISFESGLHEVFAGQIWRLVTPVFIHFGVLHLLFNMLWLLDLGSLLEDRQSSGRLLVKVLIIATVSNLAQYLASGPQFGGMSGVVFGLFGYVWVRGRLDPGCGLHIDSTSVALMMIWFVLCMTGLVGSVANLAHAAGLGVGVLWGILAAKLNPGD
jgi:GlpG protein